MKRQLARWKAEELQLLSQHYSKISTPRLTQALQGRSVRSISSVAFRLGLKKVPDRLREMGRENREGTEKPQSAA